MTNRLHLEGLSLTSRDGTTLVDGVELLVAAGSRTALVGESGSGKSLTLLATAGLLPPAVRMSGGAVRIDGQNMADLTPPQRRALLGRDIGFVFQEPMTALNPVIRIEAQLREARVRRQGADASASWCASALKAVGLPRPHALGRAWPHQLSGGMRQRVLVAMALAAEPGLILADEPTTALDPLTRQLVLQRLGEAAQAGAGVLLVSHDLVSVGHWAQEVIVMRGGRICETGPAELVLASPAHPYTRGLLACTPTMEGTGSLSVPEIETPDTCERIDGHLPWLGGQDRSTLIEVGEGRRIAVSIEP